VESETRLIGYDPSHPHARLEGDYDIINVFLPHTGHIEGSIFDNSIPGGDLDGDADASDLSIFAAAYGSTPGDPNWNHGIADLNGDSVTGAKDLKILGNNWG